MIDKKEFITGVTNKYPDKILDKRMEIEGNVIASIYNDCLLLDDLKFSKNMFLTKDGRFYYSLANELRNKGFSVIDEVTILSNASEAVIERFNDMGGYETIAHLKEVVNTANFETYIDQLYRENLICSLYDDGFDLDKKIKIKDKDVDILKLFRSMKCEQVIDYYESKLSSYEVGQSSKVLEEEEIDFDDIWIEQLKEGENNGTPFESAGLNIDGEEINCYKFLSSQTLGLRFGTFNVLAAFSSTGKSTWIITLLMAMMYNGRNVLIISNEEQITKFKSKFLIWTLYRYNKYTKLTKSKLESGNITPEDKKQISIARNYWKENYLGKCHFISMDSTDMKVVSKKIREYTLKKGVDFVVFDTFKLADDALSGERTDLALVRDSRTLFNLARKYNITVLATAQLAERFKGTLYLTASQIGGAKAIKEICETLFEMRRVYQEELDKSSKYYINPFRKKRIDGKWIEEEYHVDPTASYAILFPEKNRNGNDSSNGEAYLLKFLGHYSVFKEVAFCRPKHGQII